MGQSFIVPARFCGPPNCGNGGYTCGMVAREMGGTIECTLRKPVPLGSSLSIGRADSGAVVRRGDEIIVEAVAVDFSLESPACVLGESSRAVMEKSPALDAQHPFPRCFVCGPQRSSGDGLRIFPGPLNDTGLYGASWSPPEEFRDNQRFLKTEFLWAALDCLTGFAAGFPTAGKLVTGRLAVKQLQSVRTGEECVLLSWPLRVEGRKHFSAACLYQHQMLCAITRATWIRLEESS